MWRSVLMGLVAGARSMTPLAAVSGAARGGSLPHPAPGWLGQPVAVRGLQALAAAEMLGDKLRSAPDRIVPAGIFARVVSGGLTGAVLAPRGRGAAGAAVGAACAVGAAYVTFQLRMAALRRFGQTRTGLIEDALAAGLAERIVAGARRSSQIQASQS